LKRIAKIIIVIFLLMCFAGCAVYGGLPPADEQEVPAPEDVVLPREILEEVSGGAAEHPALEEATQEEEEILLNKPEPEEHTGEERPPADEPPQADELPPTPFFAFIDAHADTITRALLRDQGLFRNNLHVDFERLTQFDAPVQVFVLWCADRYVADAFNYTNSLIDYFEIALEEYHDIIELALTPEDLERNARNNKISAILSIEGGEALMGDIKNLDHFYDRGVRILALTWNRENELGYGQATNSVRGLKQFGFEVLERMEELGIMLDVSHLNETGFWDAHNQSTRPYMASHSNVFSLVPHRRNLTDDQIIAVAESSGIIGLALYPLFLSEGSSADISDIMRHIGHFISLGAGENLGLGGDLDGFRDMPEGLECVLSYKILAEEIAAEFGEEASQKIMSGNFYNFFLRYFSEERRHVPEDTPEDIPEDIPEGNR